jgi:hypothetical protein
MVFPYHPLLGWSINPQDAINADIKKRCHEILFYLTAQRYYNDKFAKAATLVTGSFKVRNIQDFNFKSFAVSSLVSVGADLIGTASTTWEFAVEVVKGEKVVDSAHFSIIVNNI